MTEYRGEYGQRWDRRLPRDSIKRYVDRQHVSTPFPEIAAAIRMSCARNPEMPQHMYDACERYARCVYDANRELVRRFRL